MPKLPDTIIRGMRDRVGKDKTVKYGELLNEFAFNCYGSKRARVWIETFINLGVLSYAEDDRLSCIWWE